MDKKGRCSLYCPILIKLLDYNKAYILLLIRLIMGEISRRQFLKSAGALTAIGILSALTTRLASGYPKPNESQKVKIMDLDNYLRKIDFQNPSVDDYLRLMLHGAIMGSAQAIYLKPDEYQVQHLTLIENERYEEVPIPGFKIYNELRRRAQNTGERKFIARYQEKDHLVEMSIRDDKDKRKILELKIAA